MTCPRLTRQGTIVAAALTGLLCSLRSASAGSAGAAPTSRTSRSEADGLGTAAGAQVTFSGFQRGKSGDGVVFVHVTQRTGLGVKHEGTRVKVRLHGASIKGRNNLHPLDLSQFNLLILSSRLVVVDGDVELQMELRHEAHLDAQWVERPDGVLSLHVLVPKQ